MKKEQVTIGGVYSAKITDKVVPVRIDAENKHGGWDATNLQTNRKVRIKSPQRLRGRIKVPGAVSDANAEATGKAAEPKRAKKKLTAAERKALAAQHGADQEQTRTGDSGGGKASKAAPKQKKLSLIDAAAQVLAESGEPMNCKQMVEQVSAKKLWSTNAATPHATLYSAILRELQKKGADARFRKVDRGHFALAKGA